MHNETVSNGVGPLIFRTKNSIPMEDMMWKLEGADLEARNQNYVSDVRSPRYCGIDKLSVLGRI